MISLCFLHSYTSLEEALIQTIGISRSKLKKGKISKKFLKKKILEKDQVEIPEDLINLGMINPRYHGPDIKIIKEDEFFLVLEKPPQVHCHPLLYSDQINCLSFIRERYENKEILNIGKDFAEKGLLYRLDYETSGVLVYCKSDSLFTEIRKKFKDFFKQKIYQVVVEGNLQKLGVLEDYLIPVGKNGHKMAVVNHSQGAPASLEILETDYNEKRDISFVRVALHSGLRHQIRVQLANLGHPIVGDPLYGKKGGRLMLHARKYDFEMDDCRETFESDFDLFSLFL